MLQGAMVGICDWGAPLTLYPVDTQGTPEGVRAALKVLEQRDPACILGPLLFPEVQEVVRALGQAHGGPHPPFVAFSNDPATCKTLEPFGVCLGNFLQDRVSALLDQGKKQSWSVYALLVPDTPWGQAVRDVIQVALEQRRLRCSTVVLFNPSRIDPGVFDALRDSGKADAWILVDHGARLEALMAHLEALRPGIPVMLPGVVSPEAAMSLSADNLWMALPCQSRMDGFRARYKNLFGQVPPGLASLSYDSLALVVLARDEKVQTSALSFWQRPQGFEGLQATFRFVDGASRLLMGVWQKKGGELHCVQPPQERF
jgi:branched-chain amino acid transport system substrate-binding protein